MDRVRSYVAIRFKTNFFNSNGIGSCDDNCNHDHGNIPRPTETDWDERIREITGKEKMYLQSVEISPSAKEVVTMYKHFDRFGNISKVTGVRHPLYHANSFQKGRVA